MVFFCYMLFLSLDSSEKNLQHVQSNFFTLGLENIKNSFLQDICPTRDVRVGLITNQTGKDQRGRRNVDLLLKKGINIKKIFTPEHGLSGMIHTDKMISNSVDKKTKIPIVSLYSQGKMITINADMVKDIDLLMFDIQDAGMRHYTYITTLYQAMESSAKCDKIFVVLDRPSLLGNCMDGPLVEKGFRSGISIAPIPLRHGMTVGELAIYFNKYELENPIYLYVVPMKNYKRNSFKQNQLLTYLSSGIRNLNACYCYSFLGLLGELRPFSIGLGTDKRFQALMISDSIQFPKQKWVELKRFMKKYGVEGVLCGQVVKNKTYRGLSLNIRNICNVSSFNLLIRILAFFKKSGVPITFSRMFDIAMGTDKVRLFFDGKIKKRRLECFVNKSLSAFYHKASSCFLYAPFPKIMPLNLHGV